MDEPGVKPAVSPVMPGWRIINIERPGIGTRPDARHRSRLPAHLRL